MKRPIDATALVIAERSGVEIDYCPHYRGVWLDRGELDKIIERSASYAAPPSPPPAAQERIRGQAMGYGDTGFGKKKKRGGFLEDLFDF
jgi:Zn-finger nucleic acid-binding protein